MGDIIRLHFLFSVGREIQIGTLWHTYLWVSIILKNTKSGYNNLTPCLNSQELNMVELCFAFIQISSDLASLLLPLANSHNFGGLFYIIIQNYKNIIIYL